jgi:meiotically up-regulated gene 157 (Mug157) protein
MTIIENTKGICTIYIEKKVIIDIYLIKEKMFVSDKDDIMHILNTLKQNIQKKLK